MLKARKWLNFPTPPLFEASAPGNPLECRDEIWHQKTRIVGLPDAEEIMIQYWRVTEGRTDTLLSQFAKRRAGNKKAQLSLTNSATRKHAKNCSYSTCLQRCRWQYWSIFIRLAVVASEICEIPRNSLKIQTYRVQGHPRSSILVPIESAYVLSY